ncbi:MAG TPA: hypothetical protein VK846_18145 [Candidatus Limnocylindria bacterium]|nr:hypothetical protein [Candidatus Limnocylindria bacterium]
MYCTDSATGRTKFETAKPAAAAREVVLECFNEQERFRVTMTREESRWTARVTLPMGWFFYRFHVDGHPEWDRDVGRMNAIDGGRYSLAVINRRQLARS